MTEGAGTMKTGFNPHRAGERHDARPERDAELIKRALRNAGGDPDKARSRRGGFRRPLGRSASEWIAGDSGKRDRRGTAKKAGQAMPHTEAGMRLFRNQIAIIIMALATCAMANGCFSCSTSHERTNPAPVGSSPSSSTDFNATAP